MQKIFKFLGLFLFIILAVGFYNGLILARITGDMPTNPDALCVGASGVEICVNSDGDIIPTTDNAADLGSPSLEFKNGYFDGTLNADSLAADAAVIGALTGTTITMGSSVFTPVLLSSTALAAYVPAIGEQVYNTTRGCICVGTAAVAGALVYQSTNPITNVGVTCKE